MAESFTKVWHGSKLSIMSVLLLEDMQVVVEEVNRSPTSELHLARFNCKHHDKDGISLSALDQLAYCVGIYISEQEQKATQGISSKQLWDLIPFESLTPYTLKCIYDYYHAPHRKVIQGFSKILGV